MDARDTFRKNLYHYMALRHVTQTDIVRNLHLSQSTVSDWCTGKGYPRPEKMQRLADYLQVRMTDLTDDKADGENTAMEVSPAEQALIRAFRRLTPGQQRSIAQLIQTMDPDSQQDFVSSKEA